MKILIFLQNAWGIDRGTHEEWLRALWQSHTGRQLRTMLPVGVEIEVDNASPKIGETSGAWFLPDIVHMQKVIEHTKPDVIMACGRLAQAGMMELKIPYITAPHPAWRQLTKELKKEIRQELQALADLTKLERVI